MDEKGEEREGIISLSRLLYIVLYDRLPRPRKVGGRKNRCHEYRSRHPLC